MSKQESAYRELRRRLASGQYGPGHRLVIDRLAAEFEVSAIPVREAIRRLEAEGWVTFRPHVGAEVAPITADAWVQALELTSVLEGRATALAAEHLTTEDLATLRAFNERMRNALDELDLRAFGSFNHDFHAVFYDRCGQPWLQTLLADLQSRHRGFSPDIFSLMPSRSKASPVEHEELVAAIERGEPATVVERLAREHKMRTAAAYRTDHDAQAA
ncbi:GntR family transcriptional regulator [Capillimicrobium parvum]|uniref:HTH gntR-type domain-containing protein n=1 Tax=Capillimicrobium parvum TaxID=2884022 RepID=A0A9E6XTY9_9ACTN|nr:GntR family transcriptional regulator [Capillimicrobium parvum]UGS34073.1 hypothetical protein DSM104329_00444 [Capillimicrobium parvum]